MLGAINVVPPTRQASALQSWITEVPVSVLPSVISTVIIAHPNLLSAAVKEAVSTAPAQAYAIVCAAAKTPGASLRDIIAAACAGAPGESYQIAQAILDVNSNAGNVVLQTIAANVPQLAPLIGLSGSGSALLSRQQTLAILLQAFTSCGWPANPAPASQWPTTIPCPDRPGRPCLL